MGLNVSHVFNVFFKFFFECFTALQLCSSVIAMSGQSVSLSVPSFVRLSVKRVNCDKTKETSAQIFPPHESSMHIVLGEKEWLAGDVPLYLKFCAKSTHPLQNGDFQSIFARSASTVTSSEKSSIITNRKSTIRSFQ